MPASCLGVLGRLDASARILGLDPRDPANGSALGAALAKSKALADKPAKELRRAAGLPRHASPQRAKEALIDRALSIRHGRNGS